MKPEAARVVLKQHRVEVLVASGAAIITCLVAGAVEILGSSLDGASLVVGTMRVLPFVAGLLAGVPIVSRELESRTAQFSWAIFGSRTAWLRHQTMPIAAVVGLTVTLAALSVARTASGLEALSAEVAFQNIGAHGVPAIARAFAAFGIGLLSGAFAGRALPALALGAVVCVTLVVTVDQARTAWIGSRSTLYGGSETAATVMQTGWMVRSPMGEITGLGQAIAAVPAGEADPPAWLEANGYVFLPLGIERDVAMQWATCDALFFGCAGAIAVVLASAETARRRPH